MGEPEGNVRGQIARISAAPPPPKKAKANPAAAMMGTMGTLEMTAALESKPKAVRKQANTKTKKLNRRKRKKQRAARRKNR